MRGRRQGSASRAPAGPQSSCAAPRSRSRRGCRGARVRLGGPDRARSLPDCGRSGSGRAGRLGGTRAAKVGEDGLDGEGVLDGGDNTQPAATAGTSEDIEGEHAVHQRRPGPGACGDGSAGLASRALPSGPGRP